MITGFNTDVEHEGVVYHVQTEDKGLDSPLILSLVYVGGAILASKRSPYDDLIKSGFDERELAERLQRQHKLICAAIRSGRIEDLKRMSRREPDKASETAPASASEKAAEIKEQAVEAPLEIPPVIQAPRAEAVPQQPEPKLKKASQSKAAKQTMRAILSDVVSDFARAEAEADNLLYLSLLDEKEFRGGDVVVLNIKVGRGLDGRTAIQGADVTVKILGSTFRPLIFPTRTDADGIATVRATLPHFLTGRAAILVRAIANGYEAELRRIIHQG